MKMSSRRPSLFGPVSSLGLTCKVARQALMRAQSSCEKVLRFQRVSEPHQSKS